MGGGSEAQKARKDEKDQKLLAIIKINRLATLVQMTYYVQELNEEEEGVHEFIEDEQFGTQQMSPEGNAMSIIKRVDEQYQEFFFWFCYFPGVEKQQRLLLPCMFRAHGNATA